MNTRQPLNLSLITSLAPTKQLTNRTTTNTNKEGIYLFNDVPKPYNVITRLIINKPFVCLFQLPHGEGEKGAIHPSISLSLSLLLRTVFFSRVFLSVDNRARFPPLVSLSNSNDDYSNVTLLALSSLLYPILPPCYRITVLYCILFPPPLSLSSLNPRLGP